MWWRRRSWLSAQPAGTLSALGTAAHCSSTRGGLHNRHNTSTSDTAQHEVACTTDTTLLHLTRLNTRWPAQQTQHFYIWHSSTRGGLHNRHNTSTSDTAQHEVTCTPDTTLFYVWHSSTRGGLHNRHNTSTSDTAQHEVPCTPDTTLFYVWHSSTRGGLHTRHNTSTSDTAQQEVPCTPDTTLFYIWHSSTRGALHTRHNTSTSDTAQHEVTCTPDTTLFYVWHSSTRGALHTRHNTLLRLTQLNKRCPAHQTQHSSTSDTAQQEVPCTPDTTLFYIWHSSTRGGLHNRHNTLLHLTQLNKRCPAHQTQHSSTSVTAQQEVPCTPSTTLLHLTQLNARWPAHQTQHSSSTSDTAQHEVTCTPNTTLLHLTQLNMRWPAHQTQHSSTSDHHMTGCCLLSV